MKVINQHSLVAYMQKSCHAMGTSFRKTQKIAKTKFGRLNVSQQVYISVFLIFLLFALVLFGNNRLKFSNDISNRITRLKNKFQEPISDVEVDGIPLQNSKYVILSVTLPRSSFQISYIFQAWVLLEFVISER